MNAGYEALAQCTRLESPRNSCAVIIGSTSFWDPEKALNAESIHRLIQSS